MTNGLVIGGYTAGLNRGYAVPIRGGTGVAPVFQQALSPEEDNGKHLLDINL